MTATLLLAGVLSASPSSEPSAAVWVEPLATALFAAGGMVYVPFGGLVTVKGQRLLFEATVASQPGAGWEMVGSVGPLFKLDDPERLEGGFWSPKVTVGRTVQPITDDSCGPSTSLLSIGVGVDFGYIFVVGHFFLSLQVGIGFGYALDVHSPGSGFTIEPVLFAPGLTSCAFPSQWSPSINLNILRAGFAW